MIAAREGVRLSRILERSANDYWLGVYMQRHASERFDSVVLGPHFKEEDTYKVLIISLGALVDVRTTRSLEVSERIELQSDRAGVLTVA